LIKATLLSKKPNIALDKSSKASNGTFSIDSINQAFKELDLQYKRVDEVDVYNLIEYLSSKKESNWI